MNIDFHILLKWLSVTFMRSGFDVFLKPISDVFTNLYTSIKAWKKDAMLQAAITCQVMYMELIINYRLFGNYNRTVYITDGDQTTVDFIVNVPQGITYNVQLLIGLLEKYKATGKRYTIEQTQYSYNVSWTNFVCEKVSRTFNSVWADFVCEKEQAQEMQYNFMNVYYYGSEITIVPDHETTSIVVIKLLVNNTMPYLQIVVPIADIGYEAYGGEIISVQIIDITPTEDSTYFYRPGDVSNSLPPTQN